MTSLIPILQKHNFENRVTIQSFDWRTLIGIHAAYPSIPIVALLDETTVTPDTTGKSYPWLKNSKFPWLGGLDLSAAPYNGNWVLAAHSIGASVLSPNHGTGKTADATVNSVGYVPFTTKQVVEQAHSLGMTVVPWTVDAEVTISKLVDDGVDAIISNYPERVMYVARQRGLSVGRARMPSRPECLVNASKWPSM
jgi:glycerophosphoryl diester phosphodiesterase